jgi:hypothetical protein
MCQKIKPKKKIARVFANPFGLSPFANELIDFNRSRGAGSFAGLA